MPALVEHSWDWVVRNRDVLVNTLDLISFLMVTPTLVDIVLPRLAEVVFAMLAFTFVCSITLIITLVIFGIEMNQGIDIRTSPWAQGNALVILCTMILAIIIIYRYGNKCSVIMLKNVMRHYFAIGLAVFCLSRVVAIAAALGS